MSFDFIKQTLLQRESQHLLRSRKVLDSGCGRFVNYQNQKLVNFSSNDYLGLASDRNIAAAISEGMVQYGVGSGGSPLVTGYQKPHLQLEQQLCDWLGFESCLLFNSGFAANQALVSCLLTDSCALLLQDKLSHASLIEAGINSQAQFKRFRHNDVTSLAQQLQRHRDDGGNGCDKLVVTEGVFSMDGDQAPLSEISQLCRQHDAWLMVDDAHGIGLFGDKGAGSLSAANIKADVHMATFGKSVGTFGAFIGGSKTLIDYLLQSCRHYIYSTAMPAAMAMGTMKSLEIIQTEPERREKLTLLIDYFKQRMASLGLTQNQSQSAIQPIIIGDAAKTLALSQQLLEQGIWITAIRPPTVAANTARLRVTLSYHHQTTDIDKLFDVLESLL